MANYSAKVDVIISGIREAKALGDSLDRVQGAIARISKTPIELNVGGRGKGKDLSGILSRQVNDLVREFENGTRRLARSVSGLNQQLGGFSELLEQTFVKGSGDINRQDVAVKNLANTWANANIQLSEYTDRLNRLQRTALAEQGFMQLAGGQIARGVEDAGVGVQGPRLPGSFDVRETRNLMELPAGTPRLAAPGLRGIQGAMSKPGMADAIIGAGFPALFGGGPGAMIGGGLGGLAGGAMGGQLGMALSIGLSAVGQKLDQIFGEAIRATQELGNALGDLDATKLRETTILVTAEFENQNRLLLEAGQYEQARAMATKQVAAQTGALGSSTADAANAANLLKNSFDNMMSPVNSLLANLAAPFTAALAGILNIVGLIAKGINVIVSGIGQLLKGATEWLVKLIGGQKALEFIKNLTGAAKEEQEALRAAAEAEIDAGIRNLQLKQQLLNIERDRLQGTNRIARASQIEADFRSKAAQIQAEKENEIRKIYADGSKLTEEQRNLKIQIAEATAEQKLQEAGVTAEKAKQKLLDDEAIAKLQMAGDLQQAQAKYNQTLLSSESQRLQIAIERLQQEQQFSMSLNQQTGYINNIANLRKQQAQAEYQASVAASQAAVQQAANELAVTELKYKQNNADIEQLQNAQLNLQNAQLQARVETDIAGLKLEQLNYTTDIERAQAVVNAYAEDYARTNAETTRKLEEQTNAINNRATLLNAISQATQTINNIEIQSLERELERTTSTRRRKEIIEEIYKLEIENAKVQLQATRANIQAERARADVAYRTVQLKYEELKAVVEIAKAEGVITQAHYDALRAQESALRIAKDNLNTAGQVAKWQWKAADAVFKAAVDAAKLKKETTGAAQAAGNFAGNMERAAGAMGGIAKAATALGAGGAGTPFAGFGGAMAIQDPELQKKALKIWEDATKFAANKDIGIMGDIFQKARDDIAKIALQDYAKRTKDAKPLIEAEQQAHKNLATSAQQAATGLANFSSAIGGNKSTGVSSKSKFDAQLAQLSAMKSAVMKTGSVAGRGEQLQQINLIRREVLRRRAEASSSTANSAPIPLTSGLTLQPSGGPGTAVIDRMPSTINLQTGPVLQQENGEKYVRLADLETILQDFAATVFNNARSTGGRRFQGVN